MSAGKEFIPLNIAVLTVSDSRTKKNDTSGDALQNCLEREGHFLAERKIVKDDIYQIRAVLSQWIVEESIQVVITTGGTGFSGRDSTPEAAAPLFDKHIEGFGELFRAISYNEIGSSTVQSRALAGFANETVIFCIPGSTDACRTAWNKVLKEQLDARHAPCNFVSVLATRKNNV